MTRPPGTRREDPVIPSIQPGLPRPWRSLMRGTTDWWRDNRRWDREEPSPGRARLSPGRAEAGAWERFVFTFKVGEGGIAPYGHVAVELPFTNLVLDGPDVGRGHKAIVRPDCSRPGPLLEATLSTDRQSAILDMQFTGYGLEEGDTVEVLLGVPESYPVVVPDRSIVYRLITAVDSDNTGIYHRVAASPTLEVVGGPVTHFGVMAPAVV